MLKYGNGIGMLVSAYISHSILVSVLGCDTGIDAFLVFIKLT